jgi:dienelactone hydrolase
LVGVSFGGGYALVAAADDILDGVVTWHGTRMDGWRLVAHRSPYASRGSTARSRAITRVMKYQNFRHR